jgi:leader peptidase (prepilin peptidase)/N-methyltransferase
VGGLLNIVISNLPVLMEREWATQCNAFLKQVDEETPPPFGFFQTRLRCPTCVQQPLVKDLIPLLSYVFQQGKCSHCGQKISVRYPLVEILAVTGSLLSFRYFGATVSGLGIVIFLYALIVLTFIDIETQLLPDVITQPLLWLGLMFNLNGTFISIQSAVLGAVAGYLMLWIVFWLFKLVTGKEGFGYGDFKFLAALGAWLGWQQLPLVLVIASVTATICTSALIVSAGKDKNTPVPFGPYLAMGAGLVVFGYEFSFFFF